MSLIGHDPHPTRDHLTSGIESIRREVDEAVMQCAATLSTTWQTTPDRHTPTNRHMRPSHKPCGLKLMQRASERQKRATEGSVSYTHLTLPTTPYV